MDGYDSGAEDLQEDVQWVDEEELTEKDMARLCIDYYETVEQKLSNLAFGHGCQAYSNYPFNSVTATVHFLTNQSRPFMGIRL